MTSEGASEGVPEAVSHVLGRLQKPLRAVTVDSKCHGSLQLRSGSEQLGPRLGGPGSRCARGGGGVLPPNGWSMPKGSRCWKALSIPIAHVRRAQQPARKRVPIPGVSPHAVKSGAAGLELSARSCIGAGGVAGDRVVAGGVAGEGVGAQGGDTQRLA